MTESIHTAAELCAIIVEAIGIGFITLNAIYALLYAVFLMLRREEAESIFRNVRQSLGRGILLGLEFLVAADIIFTVAVELSFGTLGALAIVVVLRTFLSFSLEVELTGHWPWQQKAGPVVPGSGPGEPHRNTSEAN